jgi:hypothetical protein
MSNDEFDSPATGGKWDKDAALGHLVVIDVLEYRAEMTTAYGEGDAVRINVLDVDDPDLSVEDALVFGAIVGAMRPKVGKRLLARLGRGTPKPGQSAPWILEDAVADPEAVKAAKAALAAAQPVSGPTPKAKAAPRGKAAAAAGPVPF